MNNTLVWQEPFRVRSYEVGPDGRVFLSTVCNYLQEAAAHHASHLGFSIRELEPMALTWVLLRLQVAIDRYPTWMEELRVETWPAAIEGRFAHRDFLLVDASDAVCARATTTWITFHLGKRRPVPIPEAIQNLHRPQRPRALEVPFPRLRPPKEAPASRKTFPVIFSDIDLNRHVNNTRYIDWALEPMPPEARFPHHLFAEFRAEAHHDDTIESRCYRASPAGVFLSTLHQEETGTLLATVQVHSEKMST